jgi:hypothetical protein
MKINGRLFHAYVGALDFRRAGRDTLAPSPKNLCQILQ